MLYCYHVWRRSVNPKYMLSFSVLYRISFSAMKGTTNPGTSHSSQFLLLTVTLNILILERWICRGEVPSVWLDLLFLAKGVLLINLCNLVFKSGDLQTMHACYGFKIWAFDRIKEVIFVASESLFFILLSTLSAVRTSFGTSFKAGEPDAQV